MRLGAHGSAAAYHLAKRGTSVLGFDRFDRGHTLGSSGGLSRIIRLSYYEHPDYVPLLRRAWDLWREVEAESGERLLTQTGGVYAGRPDGELVPGALASARPSNRCDSFQARSSGSCGNTTSRCSMS